MTEKQEEGFPEKGLPVPKTDGKAKRGRKAGRTGWRGQPFYSPAETADILAVTRRSVDRYLAEGLLHAVKVGGKWRITEADIDRFVNSGTNWDTLTAGVFAPLEGLDVPQLDVLGGVPGLEDPGELEPPAGMEADFSPLPGIEDGATDGTATAPAAGTAPKQEGNARAFYAKTAAAFLALLKGLQSATADLREGTAEAKSLEPKIRELKEATTALERATAILAQASADARRLGEAMDRLATALEKATPPAPTKPMAPLEEGPAAKKTPPRPEPPRLQPPAGRRVPNVQAPNWVDQDRSRKTATKLSPN